MDKVTPSDIRRYDKAAPGSRETSSAVFALGCFWGPDAKFGALEGVVRTRVGYAGGSTSQPTYRSIGDHTESLLVEYDPDTVSYEDLLGVAFRSHDPTHRVRKTQYQNAVFVSGKPQKKVVNNYLEESGFDPDSVETRVEELSDSEFYIAEDYHQKYKLRSHTELLEAFKQAGYDDADLRDSPAAAKVNGYVSRAV